MATFPSYCQVLLDGFSVAPNSAVLRTETDDGFAKQAKRYSRVLVKRPVSVQIKTRANLAAFIAWVKNDIAGGAGWFDWIDPITEQTIQARIEGGKYSYSTMGSMELWKVTFTLESWES